MGERPRDRITATVDTQTGEFLDGGCEPDDRYIRVEVPRNPDSLREYWDGTAIAPKAPEDIVRAFERKAHLDIPRHVRALLVHGLGDKPSQDAIAAACSAYLEVLKGLP